ncbi:hypothetical protein AAHC03_020589 [Spirometra sp. Aus1]
MKMSGVRLHCLVLLLALFIFVAEVQAVGICDWDMRTYTTQKGSVHLRTVRSGRYGRGYIGEVPFAAKWFSRTTCYLGDVKFRCVYADDGEILGTNMTVPNITNVDTIFIDSTYPVTVHRIETHVQNKSFTDRFIVDEDMHLTKCPKYKRTTLVWKFPGTVQTRGAFECFRGDVRLCRGTTIKNEIGKCAVTVAGENLIHTLAVKEPKDVKPTPPMEDKKNDPKEQNATPPVAPPKQGNRSDDRQQPDMTIAHTTSDARRLMAHCLGAIVLLVVTLGGHL